MHRVIPEPEAVHTIVRLGDCKEALPVIPLDTRDQRILSVQHERAAVEYAVHAQALHHMGIRLRVHVVHPEGRNMLPCQHRILPPVIDAVIEMLVFPVGTPNQRFIRRIQFLIALHPSASS